MSFTEVCQQSFNLVSKYQNLPNNTQIISSTKIKISESLEIINEALHKYSPDEIALSYNGGKDCLVMLILLLSELTKFELHNESSILTVLINDEEQFPELIEFIDKSSKQYHLKIIKYNNNLKDGFGLFLKDYPKVKSIIVGTRSTDPFSSNLKPFQKTDNDWPEFIRINPILQWKYDEIWSFLKELDIEYCELYDYGYTSIGGVDTTIPNPYLKRKELGYLPAYELKGENSDELERVGRIKKSK